MKKILIIGACSAIARCYGDLLAKQNCELFLVARDAEKLAQTAKDLSIKGASVVHTHVLDVNDVDAHQHMFDSCLEFMRSIDIAVIAHGTLPDQDKCQQSAALTSNEFSTNALNTILLLTRLANIFERQKAGTIAVITSVAGDRGRPSNYVYGAAKAAVSVFCEGLRVRLYKSNVHLVDIRPGFVKTPMTKHLSLPELLLATPEKIAQYINAAVLYKKDVVYTPWFWFWILLIIKNIPSYIFKKMHI